MADRVEIDIIARTEKAVSGLKTLVKNLAATYVSYQALKKIVTDSVKAYLQAEEAMALMNAALRSTGGYSSAGSKSLQELASRLQGVTKYGDETSMAVLGVMMSVGRMTSKMAGDALPLVQDFAAAMGIDLQSAGTLFAKAMAGNVGALSRYGIKVQEGLKGQELFAALTDQLRQKFGGMAQAIGDTASGSLTKLNNAFSDMQEELGRAVVGSMKGFIDWLTTAASGMARVMKAANDLRDALKNQAKGIADNVDKQIIANARWTDAAKKIKELDEATTNGTNIMGLMQEAVTKGYSSLQAYRKAMQDVVNTERQRSEGLGTVIQKEKDVADKRAAAMMAEAEYQEQLAAAYGKTSDGQREALEATIKNWEGHLATARDGKEKIAAILRELYKEYEEKFGGTALDPEANAWEAARKAMADALAGMGKIQEKAEEVGKSFEDSPSFNFLGGSSPEEMEKFYREQEAYVSTLASEWLAVADAAVQFGSALASGDVTGALAGIIQQASQAAIAWAVPAAAKAYASGDMANFAYFMGIAGIGVLGSIFAGVMKQGGKAEVSAMAEGGIVTSPRLALIGEKGPEAVVPLGKGIGGNTIIVQGSIWSERDLAKAIAGVQARW